MKFDTTQPLAIIAGKGCYPILLAQSAKAQGVPRVFSIAFRKETDPAIEKHSDQTAWIYLGQLGHMLDALRKSGAQFAVMAGQITPTHLFRIRMDAKMMALLKKLKHRNAETIFSAVADELSAIGIGLLPASTFMMSYMPAPGLLSKRRPSPDEESDIALGIKVARLTSSLDIGQTVAIKNGTILAVEAFEGTDETIMRAAKLGGAGIVVAKTAKIGHDARFDIPVVGTHTVKILRKTRASVLAVEAHRSIFLEREKVVEEADRFGLSIIALPPEPGTEMKL